MNRQASTGGRWLDLDAVINLNTAQEFREAFREAADNQREYECLYRSTSGRWVLCRWSRWDGSTDTWEEIDLERATAWLLKNGHRACQTGQF